MPVQDIDSLIHASLNGEKLPTARLISLVERGDQQAPYIMEKISPHSGNAYYIGVTGPPGAGKSTTVDRLVTHFCRNNYSVGVIAVDPTSPFSGGALLGDRIRMNADNTDRDIFFRSMSSGRVMGGLARTAGEAAKILDASGRQIIIIETVGVGQSELDIAQSTDTVLVILMPESGDHIQGSRFSGSAGAQQSKKFTMVNAQGDVIDGFHVPKQFKHVVKLKLVTHR